MSLKEITRAASQLSPKQRIKLISDLQRLTPDEPESQEEIDAAWDKEIRRRIEEVKTGKVKLIPLDEAMRTAREGLAK